MTQSKLASHRRTAPLLHHAGSNEDRLPVVPEGEPSASAVDPIPESAYFDLVIIGSGPAALALLSRLLEKRPAALYLEDEHRYLHWLHSKSNKTAGHEHGRSASVASIDRSQRGWAPLLRTQYRPGTTEKVFSAGSTRMGGGHGANVLHFEGLRPIKILILDRIGSWMGLWNRLFDAYQIPHLRSPMFFHPSPSDQDALVAYANRKGRGRTGTWTPQLLSGRGCFELNEDNHDLFIRRAIKSMKKRNTKRGEEADTKPQRSDSPQAMPELIEIRGCVGKEITKHRRKKARAQHHHNHGGNQLGAAVNERDRRDYYTPGTRLFSDFIKEDIIKRYKLPGGELDSPWPTVPEVLERHFEAQDGNILAARADVVSMTWEQNLHVAGQGRSPAMLIRTADDCIIAAGTVVSAVGPGGVPNVPAVLKEADRRRAGASTAGSSDDFHGPGWCHSAAFARLGFQFPPAQLKLKQKSAGEDAAGTGGGKTCVVIGGGLTSAQLCILALKKGFDKVYLVLRGHLKVKPFDVGLDWLSKWGNAFKMRFWQEDDPAERLLLLREARNGGSITPPYAKYLRELECEGRVVILTHTEIDRLNWIPDAEQWRIKLKCTCVKKPTTSDGHAPTGETEDSVKLEDGTAVDFVDDPPTPCEPCSEPACTDVRGEADDSDSDVEKDLREKGTHGSALNAPLPESNTETRPEDDVPITPTQHGPQDLLADYIIASTGPTLDIIDLPAFRALARQHPIPTFGGLPLLNEDLQWQTQNSGFVRKGGRRVASTGVSQPRLFCVGAYSALQLGPAAFNLGGMREAAERVAARLLQDWEAETEAEIPVEVPQSLAPRPDRDREQASVTEPFSKSSGHKSRGKVCKEAWQTGRWSDLGEEAMLGMA
ncbi:hypothetical protein OC861_005652 [Tilletia horrida]|nr:hypothetical protein OC845_002084 [Tilletia horrida]KAK0561786.1 hypothetical protein OC861_005652 [Tilletia horrida]